MTTAKPQSGRADGARRYGFADLVRFGQRSIAIGLIVAVVLYYGTASYLLRYRLEPFLFPSVVSVVDVHAPVAARIVGPSGDELLLRRYGEPRIGCAIFFPGQHGERAAYRRILFRKLVESGVAVFAASYPGQDGAAGPAILTDVPKLAHRAALGAMQDCAPRRTVILGRSLGSVVAVYAAAGTSAAGIVLDSTAPALSSAIRTRIRSRWYLRPLALLPVRTLLRHDYSLSQAIERLPGVPVIVFQGTADRRTPISALQQAHVLPASVRLVPVAGASHADTFRLALDAYVRAVVTLLDGNSTLQRRRDPTHFLGRVLAGQRRSRH